MKQTLFSLLIPLITAAVMMATIQVAFAMPAAKLISEDTPDPPITSGIHMDIEAHDEWMLAAAPADLAITMNYTYPVVDTPSPIVQGWMASIHVADVLSTVNGLSGETPVTIGGSPYSIVTRRTDSGEPIAKAVQYVGERLADAGLDVEYHPWQGSGFGGTYSGENVIGVITGTVEPEKIFMIVGHLDSQPAGGVAPGADDNASGSTAVLLTAETLSPYEWGCTLRFALWTGEEQGLLGSEAYAERARSNNEQILGVLNFDMIAWNTAGTEPDIDIHTRQTMTSSMALAEQFADVIDVYGLNLVPEIIPNGTGASDHASFWSEGYPAILGIEDYHPSRHDFNPYYHTTNDLVQHLDMDYFTEFVRASVGGLAHMSDCLVTGTLYGRVTEQDENTSIIGAALSGAALSGAPIGGTTVAATNSAGHSFATSTDGSGYFTITLPVGVFDVTFAALGYQPETITEVDLATGAVTMPDISLRETAPLSVDVAATNIQSEGSYVFLSWSTLDESALSYFHVVRQPEDGDEMAVVTESPVAAVFSGVPIGSDYQFVDRPGIRHESISYKLQIFYIDGTMREMHLGTAPRHPAIYLPMVQ